MVVFMGVQYNDPDGLLWIAIYAIPAMWAACAAFKPQWLQTSWVKGLLLVSLFSAIAGLIYFWPVSDRWWSIDVWYDTETAREGMGMMVVTMVLLFIGWSHSKKQTAQ